MKMKRQIGVIGRGKAKGELYASAEELGKEIAKSGSVLVCGGLFGVMEACAKGAKRHGGITVGILPGKEKGEGNEFIDIRIVTAQGHARNAIITRTADVLIAVGGGLGTLSETFLGLNMEKPVIVIKGFGKVEEVARIVGDERIYFADTPKEAVKLAVELAGS